MFTDEQKKEQLNNLEKKSLDAAILFNSVVKGKTVSELSDTELLEALSLQDQNITRSECLEFIEAFGKDIVEVFDGAADVLYTAPYLQFLLQEVVKRDLFLNVSVLPLAMTIELIQLCAANFPANSDNSYSSLEKVVNLVIENNLSKFTTDKEVFDSWKSPFNRVERVINGETYYLLMDNNGKCRKHDDFIEVDLSEVVEEYVLEREEDE